MKKIFILLISTISLFQAYGQEVINKSKLKIEDIMKGNSFIGHQPENIRWTMDNKKIVFDWNPYDNPISSTYYFDLKSEKIDSVTADFFKSNAIFSDVKNKTCALYLLNGNLYRYELKTGEITPILENSDYVRNLQYAQGTNHFYFQIDKKFYSYNPSQNNIREVVNFKKGSEPSKETPNYMEVEEGSLFEYHQRNKRKNDWAKDHDLFESEKIKAIFINNSSVSNIQISGDGGYITFRLNDYPNGKETHVESHIQIDGHTKAIPARPKVSGDDPNHQLGIYDRERDSVYFLDLTALPDIRKKPNYLKEYGDTSILYDQDRKIIMHQLIYSKDGNENVMDIRSYDNKDRWIVTVDLTNATVQVLDHQHDEAWIGGPGISGWNMASGTLGWMDNNKTIYYQSEETGYSHLYQLNIDSDNKKQLTKGNWEVHDVNYLNDKFYLSANKNHPGNREFYVLDWHSAKLTPILTKDGNHDVSISPNGMEIAYRYSYKNKPWELFHSQIGAKNTPQKITKSTTKSFDSYQWKSPDVVTFKDENQNDIYARIYKPENTLKNNAAVIFVHGAGYLQNAHNYWSGYYREYMFHNLLRDNGFTVIDIDYRASKGYGRDHRTAIYRNMGGADLEDHLLGRQYLIDSCGIIPEKIGIYGGSYGGFITLMALLSEPGKFKAGAAIRSVTDWFHYNHEYTSNILNYPETDPEAYKKSSPIYYADNLEDHLLMLHGMVDDNVQFQDVVRLSQRFIELGKEDWELAVYPIEPHGFKVASSWTDEYKRIYKLFYEELILE